MLQYITNKYSIFFITFVGACFLCQQKTYSQPNFYKDTFYVAAGNTEDLAQFVSYFIDSSDQGGFEMAQQVYDAKQFRRLPPNTSFNFGLDPHPLWLHLTVRNTNPSFQKYWWSFYSSSDSIIAYQNRNGTGWLCTDTLSYLVPNYKKKIEVRFPVLEIGTVPQETIELFVKMRDLKTVQCFYSDFTTPLGNMLWEMGFHWKTGLFVGIFLMFLMFNLAIAIVLKQINFFYYSCYVFIVILVSLKEEYLTGIFSSEIIFNLINRLHGLSLSVIGMALHYMILSIVYKNSDENRFGWLLKKLQYINKGFMIGGIISLTVVFLMYQQVALTNPFYYYYWYIGVAAIFLMAVNTFITICLLASTRNAKIVYPLTGSFFIYFSIAGYYINYTGLIHIYPVTYPNYYYHVVSAEFILVSILNIHHYKSILNQNIALLNEKIDLQTSIYREVLAAKKNERARIAMDLHDDLGTTLSTINLTATDKYPNDLYLLRMIKKACNDIRMFGNKFSIVNIQETTLKEILDSHVAELNLASKLVFNFISTGIEPRIPETDRYDIIRILFELLTNILKHSQATQATLQLLYDKKQIIILSEDNGIGYDETSVKQGNGLVNIYNRVTRLRGFLHVSTNEKGTTTIIKITI